MYSDQVGEWSPRNHSSQPFAAEEIAAWAPQGDETQDLEVPEFGASHRIYPNDRGPPSRCPAGEGVHRLLGKGYLQGRHSPAGRRASSRNGASRRSGPASPAHGMMCRYASPTGVEDARGSTRGPTPGCSPLPSWATRRRARELLNCREGQPDWHERSPLRDDPVRSSERGGMGRYEGCKGMQSPPLPPRNSRNRGGGIGIRGRGRHIFSSWGRVGGGGRRRSRSCTSVVDFEEDHKRSRSRERARRRRQYETIQRYCRPGGEQQVCWDGFQWVRKGDDRGDVMFDQNMNATRRARRLHIGNLPLLLDATEDDLKQFLWENLRKKCGSYLRGDCPVLHVWFSKERGSNYGFVEMASVEDAQAAIALNPLVWKGQQLRINRPTDWKKDSVEANFAEISGAANVALLESVAAAIAITETTGDHSGLAKLISSLPEDQRNIIADFLGKCPSGLAKQGNLPVELLQCQIQAELLHGQASRVVRITNPVPEARTDEEMEETLTDVLEEVNKRRDVLAALIITKDLEEKFPAAEVGDIYVQFASGIQADICILTFAGRMYDGRPLVIERFNEMVWRQSMQKFSKSLLKEILARFT